jgi:uncharacterized protein YbjT (DUF2867 family)
MKFIATGSLGKIGLPLTSLLVNEGHQVVVISSNSQHIGRIEALGAKAAIGSVLDSHFLTGVFEGADAIYTMVPPNWVVGDYRQYIAEVGHRYEEAIRASGVKRVVNLSSIGADLDGGNGPIAGLHDVETRLNGLVDVAVRHLRPGLFFTNFFFDIPTIRTMGVMGSNYGRDTKLVMVHPRDIAAAAAAELQGSFTGTSHRYIAGEAGSVADFVEVIGASIGKPNLPWLEFGDDDMVKGMIGGGMSSAIAAMYVEMGHAISSGLLFRDFEKHQPDVWGATKFADFAPEFAAVYGAGN